MGIEVFKKHLRENRAIKIIAGINNTNTDNVAKICRISQTARASAVDITCNRKIYSIARKNTKMPIFASSISPYELLQAAQWGVDAIQIGSFNEAFKKGNTYSADEIYDIVLDTMSMTEKYNIFICVTIPNNIEISKQIKLAKKVELLGVDLIQVETLSLTPLNNIKNELIIAEELYKHTALPIMISSNITSRTIQDAFASGIKAVGIDYSASAKNESEAAMITNLLTIVQSVSYRNSFNKELNKSKYGLFT